MRITFPLVAGLVLAAPLAAQSNQSTDSALISWVKRHARPLASVDAAYHDSAFAFLSGVTGNARILAYGEPVHGAHEPLEFRNRLVRYAVTHLGFTAVAVESGLTEGMLADDFVLGGSVSADSAQRHGFTWGFQYLRENGELLSWLREHNAHAARKVHVYGIDLTGSEDEGAYPFASRAVFAALTEMERVAPERGARLKARLEPMMNRFLPARFAELSAADRDQLRSALDTLYQALRAPSPQAGKDAQLRRARGLRNAWMAVRLNDLLTIWGPNGSVAGAALRDSTMAENTRWALEQEGSQGRLVLFAHDGHIKNAPTASRSSTFNGSWKVQGQYLRAWLGPRLVTIGSAAGRVLGIMNPSTGWFESGKETASESGTFAALLAQVGSPVFLLDLRTSDHQPVGAALERPWPFQLGADSQPFSPRQSFDAIVYFDRITPTKLLQ